MGLMRLFAHDESRLAGLEPSRVYMMGFEELPWFGHVFISDEQIVIERKESDSGSVCVPWVVGQRGELLLCTSTLIERDEPYFLEVEIARGVVHRLRNQLAAWRQLGLVVTDELEEEVRQATRHFTRAAARQLDSPVAAQAANQAIELAVTAGEHLADAYSAQALQMRLQHTPRIGTLLGVSLGSKLPDKSLRQPIVNSFNLVGLPMAWPDIEASEAQRQWNDTDEQLRWAQKNNLKAVGGPLLEFDERRVPDWTYLWEGDYDTLSSFMLDHVRNVVKRYRGKVQIWHVASRMNRPRVLSLNDEDRLQIVASAIKIVKEIDPRTPIIVSFDQPWGEYLATERSDLAPMHYADALVRADLGVSGIGLEINVGEQPRATAPRTPLEFSRLVDQWGLFELPLFLMLTIDTKTSKREEDSSSKPTTTRSQWIERHLPAMLAKNCVQVVLWNQLSDQGAEFHNAGLYDINGQAKPALTALKQLRDQYLA